MFLHFPWFSINFSENYGAGAACTDVFKHPDILEELELDFNTGKS